MPLKKAECLLGFVVLLATTMLPRTNAQRGMVGGYNPIQDYDEPEIKSAAKFAFLELFLMEPDLMPYKFMSPIIEGEGDQQAYMPKIVSGSQQVVAGLNLKLTLMVVKATPKMPEEVCQGGMDVEMYLKLDRTMEVMEWGDEYNCDQAQHLLEFRLIDEKNEGGGEDESMNGEDEDDESVDGAVDEEEHDVAKEGAEEGEEQDGQAEEDVTEGEEGG